MLKKIILFLFIIGLFFPTVFCFAVEKEYKDPLQNVAQGSGYSTEVDDTSLSTTIGGIIKSVLGMLGVIFFVLTFYAGFLWMTASGNDEKIEKAKNIITAATIGLIIIIMSYSITFLITSSTRKVTTPQTPIGD